MTCPKEDMGKRFHKNIELRHDDRFGLGLFTTGVIEEGEVVWADTTPAEAWTRQQILDHPRSSFLQTYSYMIGEDLYGTTLTPDDDVSYYYNHSCDPNCWYDGDEQLVAKRRIEKDEHVAYDYALTETEMSFHTGMECRCGGKQCRGKLAFRQYRDEQWMQLNGPHAMRFIQQKHAEQGWRTQKAYLKREKPNEENFGTFALEDIPKGEIVVKFAGKYVTTEELLKYTPAQQRLNLQVAKDLYQMPIQHESTDYVNHSCDPTCGFYDAITLITIRDVKKGEELTFDYAFCSTGTISGASDNFDCNCGSENCRGKVTSSDYKLKDVQQRLWNYFPRWNQEFIVEKNEKAF